MRGVRTCACVCMFWGGEGKGFTIIVNEKAGCEVGVVGLVRPTAGGENSSACVSVSVRVSWVCACARWGVRGAVSQVRGSDAWVRAVDAGSACGDSHGCGHHFAALL